MNQVYAAVEISMRFISDNQQNSPKAVRNNHLLKKKMETCTCNSVMACLG